MQAYSNPAREDEPHALPNVEVFYHECLDCSLHNETEEHLYSGNGWYYWYCFPGCLPDSDAIGPFASEATALKDAREEAEDY